MTRCPCDHGGRTWEWLPSIIPGRSRTASGPAQIRSWPSGRVRPTSWYWLPGAPHDVEDIVTVPAQVPAANYSLDVAILTPRMAALRTSISPSPVSAQITGIPCRQWQSATEQVNTTLHAARISWPCPPSWHVGGPHGRLSTPAQREPRGARRVTSRRGERHRVGRRRLTRGSGTRRISAGDARASAPASTARSWCSPTRTVWWACRAIRDPRSPAAQIAALLKRPDERDRPVVADASRALLSRAPGARGPMGLVIDGGPSWTDMEHRRDKGRSEQNVHSPFARLVPLRPPSGTDL